MVIQVKGGYIQGKAVRKPPVITPYKDRAWNFTNLHKCKNVRDDVLEYVKGASIIG